MAIITINGKEIEIQDFQVKFFYEKLGLDNLVKIDSIYINPIQNTIVVNTTSSIFSPTGIELEGNLIGQINIDGDIVKSLVSNELIQKITNLVFNEIMVQFGIEAEQIYNQDGQIEVITKPIEPKIETWVQQQGNTGKYPYINPLTTKPYQVSHKSSLWENTHTGGLNVWEPGVFGWKKI
jgi:hypothetical protein